VARAKRTSSERAAARRRYRAATESLETEDMAETAEASSSGARAATAAPAAPSVRAGFTAAFRGAYHRADIRSDLAWLPNVFRSKAFWIPFGLAAATAIAHVMAPSTLTYLLIQYFIWAPPIGLLFITGFLAPRASYLFGAILGLISAVIFGALLYSGAWNSSAALVGSNPVDPSLYAAFMAQWILLSVLAGPFFAGAVAWYRRFLQLSNPNRGRRQQQAQKRSADGRTRGSTPPKANTKAPVRR
jgi:hypothetical protein